MASFLRNYKRHLATLARVCIALAVCTPWIVSGRATGDYLAGATCAGFVFLAALTIITPWKVQP